MKKLNNTNWCFFFCNNNIICAYYLLGDKMDNGKELDVGFNHGITLSERKKCCYNWSKENRKF